jgi:hypothetical protein
MAGSRTLGPFKPELLIELAPRPAGKFVKDASLPDEITAAIVESSYDTKGSSAIPSRRWLSVRPTGWDEKTAGLLAKWLPKNAKADHEITDKDLAECSLIVYGGLGHQQAHGPNRGELPAEVRSAASSRWAARFTIVRRIVWPSSIRIRSTRSDT